jgi:hypothetical protein
MGYGIWEFEDLKIWELGRFEDFREYTGLKEAAITV